MMIKKYAEEVCKEIESHFDGEVETTVVESTKMNDVKLVGVGIRRVGDYNGPIFYINGYYEDGEDASYAAEDIIGQWDVTMNAIKITDEDIAWDKVKDKIRLRLVSEELSKEWLEDKIKKPIGCGLTLTADVDVDDCYKMPITENVAKMLEHSGEEIIKKGLENSEANEEAEFFAIEDGLFGARTNLLKCENAEELVEDGMLFVLTNKSGAMGASVLAYEGLLDKVGKILGRCYYILPSSIHEVIIVPNKEGRPTEEDLKKMVLSANNEVVEQKDLLSNSVYYFDGEELEEVA